MLNSEPKLQETSSVTRPQIPGDIATIVTDATAYGDGRLHDAFTWLRANQPLGIVETGDFDPFWVVTRHADIRFFATRPDMFLSGETSITPVDRAEQQRMREMLQGRPEP